MMNDGDEKDWDASNLVSKSIVVKRDDTLVLFILKLSLGPCRWSPPPTTASFPKNSSKCTDARRRAAAMLGVYRHSRKVVRRRLVIC